MVSTWSLWLLILPPRRYLLIQCVFTLQPKHRHPGNREYPVHTQNTRRKLSSPPEAYVTYSTDQKRLGNFPFWASFASNLAMMHAHSASTPRTPAYRYRILRSKQDLVGHITTFSNLVLHVLYLLGTSN